MIYPEKDGEQYPLTVLEYAGGGHFRDGRVPKGKRAAIFSASEIFDHAVQLEMLLKDLEQERLTKIESDRI